MIFARRRALVHTVPVASSRAADLWRDVWEAAKPLMVGLMNQMSWYPDEIESVQTALLQQGAWKKGLEPGYTIVVGQDHGLSHVITFLVFYVFLRLFVLNFRNLECPIFIHTHIFAMLWKWIPRGISTKEWDSPGCPKKRFFFAKTGGFSIWLTRTPHFLQRLPGSGCFRDGILRGKIDKLIECLGTSTWLTWTPYFLELCFCICSFFVFFVFFCSWLPGPWFFRWS